MIGKKKKKSFVNKEELTSTPKVIMNKLKSFYENLYSENNEFSSDGTKASEIFL